MDIAWGYVSEGRNAQGRKTMTCTYCFKVFHGGGIHRMKQHLAGVTGSITSCAHVDPAVRLAILTSLQENDKKSKEKRGDFGVENPFGQPVHEFVGDEVQEVPPPRVRDISMNEAGTSLGKGKRKTTAPTGIRAFFKGGRDSSQPTIKACLQSKDKWQNTDMAIALWFYDACIPINAVNSPFFQKAIDQIASMGHGYKAPSYHSLRVTLLRDAKKDMQLVVDSFRNTWAETGCIIMGDGWKDSRQRPLINFLVYCPKGISFIKSIDASDIVTNAENLCNLFVEIVEMDIGEMGTVKSLVSLASTVTVFVYNHKYVLNWLRKTNGWKEIIRPGETRFATTFIALKSLHDHKDSLQALVTSGDYKNENNGSYIRLLRVCDTDERPSLGYVYEGMFRAITGIKKLFRNSERLYKPYIDIINDRWDRMLRKNLHATAYFLNPAFQYDTATFSTHPEITNGLLDYIESKVDWCSEENLTKEIGMYREREGSFGRKLAILTSKKDRPENWWKLFGCDAPNLQKLAIRVLSQTASSSGCERNWSVFERIHTKKRNRLEHQKLNDLVYVHYNLRLQYRYM
nr:uncharacterized protein LOC113696566 [Coffea arabica]